LNKTSNYQLCQWDGDDRILRTDFNEDNAKIDAALKSQANSIAGINSTLSGKANTSTVTSLTNKLNTEIQERKDAVTAEAAARAQADNTEKAAREAADTAEAQAREQAINAEAAARTAALALKGNCQIYYTAYVGDGADSRTMTFPARPLLILVQGGNLICRAIQGNKYFMCRSNGEYGQLCAATWSGNSFSWESNGDYGANVSGNSYYLVALMAADE
jgi:hypothetical protein